METTSRALAPMALQSVDQLFDGGSFIEFDPLGGCSRAFNVVCGTTAVSPVLLSGLGWGDLELVRFQSTASLAGWMRR